MPLQNFLRPVPPGFFRVPLRLALVVPFVLQIFVAVGLTAFFSIRNGQRAVNDVAAELRNEVAARIHQHVTAYMETPQLVTQLNAVMLLGDEVDWRNAESLEHHFWQQMQLFQSLKPIAFGNEQEEIHSVDRLSNGTLVIRAIDSSTGGAYHTYSISDDGKRSKLIRTSRTFDPRDRPWYTTAVKAGQFTWSEIYPYFSSPELAISAAQPLYNEAGTLIGVTNATLSLSELSDFLNSLKIGRSGQTFIIENSGDLVASSTTEIPFVLVQEGEETRRSRLAALDSRDRVTRLTAQHLQKSLGGFSHITQIQQLDFKIDGERQFVQVMPFVDDYGLNWMIVVVVPEADFLERIETNTRITILLCLGALTLATVIGVLTSRWIAQPILHLSSASKDIAAGKLNQTVVVGGINELRVLAQAHNQMATQLQESFTALEKANEELEIRVEQRTSELQEQRVQLRQAYNFEATLKRITDKVRDSLDEAQILQTVVQELMTVLSAKCCAAASYDLEQKTLVINYEHAQPNWTSSLGRVITIEDIPGIHQSLLAGKCLQFCQIYSKFDRPQSAVFACPVSDDQGVLADLWLFRQPSSIYSELEIRLVQQVANQCAIAIRQAQLYQAVQAQVEELKGLNRLKDDFLSTVSHEIRTPISNMKLAIHMLKLAPTQERQQKYLDILQSECTRESSLINDLLDLQRLEADRYPVSIEAIALPDWMPSIIEPFLSRIQERQLTFHVEIAPAIPPLTSDPNSLGRLLAELLNNACKYTPAGGRLYFTVKPLGLTNANQRTIPHVSFEVSNETEIPATELSRIFEKFYRIPNADPWKQGGTGLGLALVQKLVEQLEGELQVTSDKGWTTFTVLLKNLVE